MNSMPIVNVAPQEPQVTAPEQKLAVPKEDTGKFDQVLSAHVPEDVPKVSVHTKSEGSVVPVSKDRTNVSSGKGRESTSKWLKESDLTALMVFLGVIEQQLQKVQDASVEMSRFSDLSAVKHLLGQFAGKGAGGSWTKGDINERIDSLTANPSVLTVPEIFRKQLDFVMEVLAVSDKGQDAGLQNALIDKLKSNRDTTEPESTSSSGLLLKEFKRVVASISSPQSDQEVLPEAMDMTKEAVQQDKSVFMHIQLQKPESDHTKGLAEKSVPSDDQINMAPKMDGYTHRKDRHKIQDSAGTDVDDNPHFASAFTDRDKDSLTDTQGKNPVLMDRPSRHGLQEDADQPAEYSNSDFKLLDKVQGHKHVKVQRFNSASHIERLSAQQDSSHSVNNGAATSVSSASENRSGEQVLIVDFRPGIRHETDSAQTEKVSNRIPVQSDVFSQPSSSSMHGNLQEMKAGYAVDTVKGGASTDASSRIGVLDQVSQGVQTAVAMNRNRAVIHLNPPELGSVTIRLHVDHNNHVHASFLTEHMHTHQLLESGMESLRQQLGHNGFDLGQVNVNLSGGGMHDAGTFRRGPSDHEKRRFEEMIRDDEVDVDITAPASSAGLSGLAGGVHIIM